MDFSSQAVFTRDNVEILTHQLLTFKITDPLRAVYEVSDLPHAMEKLLQIALRATVGDMGDDF